MSVREPLVADKWNPNHHVKDAISANPVIFFISCKGLCMQFVQFNLEFQFMPLPSCQFHQIQWLGWPNIWSQPPDRRPHTHIAKEPRRPGRNGSIRQSSLHSPSRSPERLPSSSPPGTWYCVGIHVTLTNEIRAEPPPPHAWKVPLVEDMLCFCRTGLTEAVVTGPGTAVLFYSRQSLGEGLRLGKARDASSTLTAAGTWIGKLTYLATDPLTIREGQQAIAQAITECWIKVRGPGHPQTHPTLPQPFRFYHPGESPQKENTNCVGLHPQPSPYRPSRGKDRGQWQQGWRPVWSWPPSPSPDQGLESDRSLVSTASSVSSQSDRSKGSWHSWHGRQHRRLEPTWRLIYPSSKMRTQRMPSPTRVGGGTWPYTIEQGVETIPSCPKPSDPCKVIQESLCGALGLT